MLNLKELDLYSKKMGINQSVVYREFIQLIFLKEFYNISWANKVFFKGGTSIRLIFDGNRFSEYLDFTVMMDKAEFELKISDFWKYLEKTYGWNIKRKKTLSVGETYLLTVKDNNLSYGIFIKLDFSFREKVLEPDKSILKTDYPIVFSSFIYHLSKTEILAEKIRAIMTRDKGRDIYDLWFLLSLGTEIKTNLVLEKLKYYQIDNFEKKDLINRVNNFPKSQFVVDLKPFVPINEREKLGDLFDYIVMFLKKKLD